MSIDEGSLRIGRVMFRHGIGCVIGVEGDVWVVGVWVGGGGEGTSEGVAM